MRTIPHIQLLSDVLQKLNDGTLKDDSMPLEITLESRTFKVIPPTGFDISEFNRALMSMGDDMSKLTDMIDRQFSDIHTKYKIKHNDTYDALLPEELNLFKNPANVIYLRYYYGAVCLFLLCSSGR